MNVEKDKFYSKQEVLLKKYFFASEMKAGKIFIYPTDTVYGLGTNAKIKESVEKIKEIKKRNNKPFLVAVPSLGWIFENCEVIGEKNSAIINSRLPGPYSFILKLKNPEVIDLSAIDGGKTIGIRFLGNWFSELIELANVPFISTSVNYLGERPVLRIEDLKEEIAREVDYIIHDDESLSGKPSAVIDLTSGSEKILRG